MQDLKQVILEHHQKYPGMLIQDVIKLVYQNEFGNGHFIRDEGASLARLETEWSQSKAGPGELFESIGNGYVRLNLACLGKTVSLTTVNRFFMLSAQEMPGTLGGFEEKIKIVKELCRDGLLPYDFEEVDGYLAEYKKRGYPAVSHSQVYRELYSPSYRVLRSTFALYFPLFRKVERLFSHKDSITLAIDGPSGAGKSTLAHLLHTIYDAPVISMDHFFLRPEQRTPARLGEPGGNVDYERFQVEVVEQLTGNTAFSYGVYNCQTQSFTSTILIQPHRLRVVEGSYSHHPTLASYYDFKVFLRISQEEQRERILKRNGPAMLERFVQEWIPLEERYFEHLKIQEQSDLVIDMNPLA